MNKNSNSNKNQDVDSTDMEIDDYLKKIMVTPLENKIDNFSEKIEEEFSEIENAVDALPTAGAIEECVKKSVERLLEQQLEELKINDNFDNLNENQEEIKAFLSDNLIPFLEEFRTSVDVDIKEIKEKIGSEFSVIRDIVKDLPKVETISEYVENSVKRLLEQQLEGLEIDSIFAKLKGNQEEIKEFLSNALTPSLQDIKSSADTDINFMKEKIDKLETEIAKSKREFSLYKIISFIVNFSVLGIGIYFIFLHFFQ